MSLLIRMLQNRKTYYYKLEDIDLNGTFNYAWASECNTKVDLGIFWK